MAKAGANVVINGFADADAIEKERSNLEKTYGIQAWYNGADLSKPDGVRSMIDDAVAKAGRLDVLVNNAGIQHTSPITEFPQDKWDLIMALMLTAPFVAIQKAIPVMASKRLWPYYQYLVCPWSGGITE